MKLKLSKEITENNRLSNNAIVSYIGLVYCCRFDYEPVFINRNMISYYLTGQKKLSRSFDEVLKSGIKELIDVGVICCEEQNTQNYYFGLKNIRLEDSDKFVFVDFDDIRKIMQCNHKGKISLLRYYIVLLGTFIVKNHITNIRDSGKYNNILGMMSQDYIANLARISTHTAVEYTKILEQLELLYVSRCSFLFKDKKGNVKRHNNIYGRYIDKSTIDEFTQVRYEMYDDLHKMHISAAANNSRSLMQKYNQLVKGKSYNKEIIKDIYNYICDYNTKYPKKEKDMSIFEQYGYKIEN
jgi:hypothetical protein